jgi:hypothetical protein
MLLRASRLTSDRQADAKLQSLVLLSADIHQLLNPGLIQSRFIKSEPLQQVQKPSHSSGNGILILVLRPHLNHQAMMNPSKSSVIANHILLSLETARFTPKAVS